MRLNGRADHIEDALVKMHSGQWYGWIDSDNRIYSNLKLSEKIGVDGNIIDNPVTELPSEETINTKLKELQDSWDLQNDSYKSNRRKEYPSIVDQLDYIYHNGITKWKTDIIIPIKEKYPKP